MELLINVFPRSQIYISSPSTNKKRHQIISKVLCENTSLVLTQQCNSSAKESAWAIIFKLLAAQDCFEEFY